MNGKKHYEENKQKLYFNIGNVQTTIFTLIEIEYDVLPESRMHTMNALIMKETKPFL
ncbi:hypothetical protein D3C78_97110 [compost metagenome]